MKLPVVWYRIPPLSVPPYRLSRNRLSRFAGISSQFELAVRRQEHFHQAPGNGFGPFPWAKIDNRDRIWLYWIPQPSDLDASTGPTRIPDPPGDDRRPAAVAQCAAVESGRPRAMASQWISSGWPGWKKTCGGRSAVVRPGGKRSRNFLRPGPADLGPAGGNRRGHSRPPGGDRMRRDRLGQVDAVAEDLSGDGPRRRRSDRPYPAATHRRAERGRTDRRGNRLAAGPRRGLQGPLLRVDRAAKLHQAHDRWHPAGRDAGRSRTSTSTTRSFSTRPTNGR